MVSEKIIEESLKHSNERYEYERSENLHKVNNKRSYINRRSDSYCTGYLDCQKIFYDKLLKSGLFWEIYPSLTGSWEKDIMFFT